MAFNIQTFKTRALTAIVFVIIMLTGLLINEWSFFILFSIIHFGCWVEFFKIIGKINPSYSTVSALHKGLVMLGGWGLMLYLFCSNVYNTDTVIHQIAWWILCLFAVAFPITQVVLAKGNKKQNIKNAFYSVLGLLYISLSWALLIHIRGIYTGANTQNLGYPSIGFVLPIMLICSIWVNDTMAYIVGSFIGKTPLSSISPKKTWEGTIGGMILCVAVVGFVLTPLIVKQHVEKEIHWFVIAAIAAIIGTIGDLLESKLKRLAGVKDSGSFMPGHGGFLDRFDSLLLATPFVWVYAYWVWM